MSPGQSQAVAKRPPHGAGTTHPLRTVSLSFTAVSSAATSAVPDGFDNTGCWVTFSSSTDCFIRFGRQTDVGSATSSDFGMTAGTQYDWWIAQNEDAYFTVIRSTADGVLKRNRSSV